MREATDRHEPTAERVAELRAMPYDDYLKTPEWQATRQRALARAGYCCQVCKRRDRLNVHHNTYERRGAEEDRDLIVLCGGEDGCHALYHHRGRLATAPTSMRGTGSPILSLPHRTPPAPRASLIGDSFGRRRSDRRRGGKRLPRWLRSMAAPVRIGAGLLLLGLLILVIARHGG